MGPQRNSARLGSGIIGANASLGVLRVQNKVLRKFVLAYGSYIQGLNTEVVCLPTINYN